MIVVLSVYRVGHLCIELLPESHQASTSNSDRTRVLKTSNNITMKDHDSSSSVSSKEGSMDAKHFIEVELFEALLKIH